MHDKYRHIINALVWPNILPLKEACKFKCFQFNNKTMSSFTANNIIMQKVPNINSSKGKKYFRISSLAWYFVNLYLLPLVVE